MRKDIHTKCNTLPKYSFDEIVKTGDYRWLVKNYQGERDFEIDNIIPFEKIFINIAKEYALLSSGTEEVKNLRSQILIAQLSFKYEATSKILNLYTIYPEIEVLLLLNDLGWSLDTAKSIGPQIDKISKDMIGLKMKIKIHKAKYNKKYSNLNNDLDNMLSLDKEALYLESNLELGYRINPRETTCERWINLKNLSKEKSDYYEKQRIKNQ